MKDELERIRRAEEQLRALEARGDNGETAASLSRRLRRTIIGTFVLCLLAFAALVPAGAAFGMLLRVLRRMVAG